jgi:hypothetical protein
VIDGCIENLSVKETELSFLHNHADGRVGLAELGIV